MNFVRSDEVEKIRKQIDHPVIDGDGHLIEYTPLVRDFLVELAGEDRHLFLDTLAAAHANAGDFDEAVRTAGLAVEEAPPEFRTYYAARREMYEQGRPYRTQPTTR